MMLLDRYAYQSRIAGVSVGQKLLFAGAPLLVCLLTGKVWVSLTVIVSMSVATVFWGRISVFRYGKLLLLPLGFLLTGIAAVMVVGIPEGTQVLFAVQLFGWRFGITPDSVQQGFLLFLRGFSALTCFYFLALHTPMNSFFNFLQKKKLSPILLDLMELIYRFTFLLWEEAGRIHAAQAARLGYRDFRTSLRSLGELVAMLFENCLNRVERMQLSLESRGFQGQFSYLVSENQAGGIGVQAAVMLVCMVALLVLERVL